MGGLVVRLKAMHGLPGELPKLHVLGDLSVVGVDVGGNYGGDDLEDEVLVRLFSQGAKVIEVI